MIKIVSKTMNLLRSVQEDTPIEEIEQIVEESIDLLIDSTNLQ